MSDFKYRSAVSHWKSWGVSLSSLQAISPREYYVIFMMVYGLEEIAGRRSLGTLHSHTFLSQYSRCELKTNGEEVNEPIIKPLGLHTVV